MIAFCHLLRSYISKSSSVGFHPFEIVRRLFSIELFLQIILPFGFSLGFTMYLKLKRSAGGLQSLSVFTHLNMPISIITLVLNIKSIIFYFNQNNHLSASFMLLALFGYGMTAMWILYFLFSLSLDWKELSGRLNISYAERNIYSLDLLCFLCVLDLENFVFFPWITSTFTEKSGGFPNMFLYQLVMFCKVIFL